MLSRIFLCPSGVSVLSAEHGKHYFRHQVGSSTVCQLRFAGSFYTDRWDVAVLIVASASSFRDCYLMSNQLAGQGSPARYEHGRISLQINYDNLWVRLIRKSLLDTDTARETV